MKSPATWEFVLSLKTKPIRVYAQQNHEGKVDPVGYGYKSPVTSTPSDLA